MTCKRLTDRFREIYREETGDEFPEDPRAQLDASIQAVFAPGTDTARSSTGG